MESINHLTRLTAAFLGLTILALGIAAIWLIRMRKKNLKTKKAETEERGLFSQTDELVPIDEIGPGVIVTNGGKKFVVVLKCGGSDFYTKPIGEKVRVKNNYAAFISEFTSRVTYRIYGEDINMDGTVREYEKILTGLQDMLFETNEDYKALRKEFETVKSDSVMWKASWPISRKCQDRMQLGRTLFRHMYFPGALRRTWQRS